MNENKRDSKEQPLKDIVDKLMKAYSLDKKMKELDVIAAWPELMGPAVAHRTKDIYIKNKMLYLSIDSSVMREQLLIGKSIIIKRLNDFAGFDVITDVWFS